MPCGHGRSRPLTHQGAGRLQPTTGQEAELLSRPTVKLANLPDYGTARRGTEEAEKSQMPVASLQRLPGGLMLCVNVRRACAACDKRVPPVTRGALCLRCMRQACTTCDAWCTLPARACQVRPPRLGMRQPRPRRAGRQRAAGRVQAPPVSAAARPRPLARRVCDLRHAARAAASAHLPVLLRALQPFWRRTCQIQPVRSHWTLLVVVSNALRSDLAGFLGHGQPHHI